MLDGHTVFCRLVQLTECFDEDESICLPYCETAAAVLNSKIRADADASDIRLVTAAAAMAYCRYLIAKSASDGDVDSVKAGDITISGDSSKALRAAQAMLDATMLDAAELLADNGFSFRVV